MLTPAPSLRGYAGEEVSMRKKLRCVKPCYAGALLAREALGIVATSPALPGDLHLGL